MFLRFSPWIHLFRPAPARLIPRQCKTFVLWTKRRPLHEREQIKAAIVRMAMNEHALGEKYPQSRGLAASYLRNRHGFSLNPLLRAVSYNIGADHLAPSRGDPDGIDGEAPSFEVRRCETLQSLGA
jgi:hypothetical protein